MGWFLRKSFRVGRPRVNLPKRGLGVIGIVLGVGLAHAGESTRVDLFDTHGRRTGYAVVDRDTGRVDFYDTMSRRTGYGRVDGAGKVERFGVDGKRQGETALPVPRKADRPRCVRRRHPGCVPAGREATGFPVISGGSDNGASRDQN